MPPGPNYSSTADEDSNLDTSALNRSPHLFQGAAVSQQIITQMSLSSPHRTSTTGGYSTTSRKSLSPQTSSFSLPDSPTEPLAHRLSIGIMYGLINAAVVLPVMMSFGTIIYHDEAFSPYLPTLIKLTLVSSVVHQLCFSYWSSLPYSIGQVQDAGLIFLSAMSTMISTYTKDRGYDDEHMLATATIGLSLCTAVLGIGLMIIGKARLASYVQVRRSERTRREERAAKQTANVRSSPALRTPACVLLTHSLPNPRCCRRPWSAGTSRSSVGSAASPASV